MTTHEACATPIEDSIRQVAEKLSTGEWRLILEHPNPAEGTSVSSPEVSRAIGARLSALLPEDAAGLVERLRKPWDGSPGCRDRRDAERAEAASLIQSQAARERALKHALEHVTELLVDTWHVIMPASNDPEKDAAVMRARALLNEERKG